MTEHRPAFQASTGVIETAVPDTLLLIPMLQSGQATQDESICLHLVYLESGNLGLCSVQTGQVCPCCRLPICPEHQSTLCMRFADDETEEGLLCETCAALSVPMRLSLHDFVTTISDLQSASLSSVAQDGNKPIPRLVREIQS